MGIPYSKQINSAFDQVTPLVAAGFRILKTSRNISILLAAIQIVTTLLQFCILLALVALLITTNPDLEYEREVLVTPAVRRIAAWAIDRAWLRIAVWTVFVGAGLGATAGWRLTRDSGEPGSMEAESVYTFPGDERAVEEVAGQALQE